MQELSVWGGVHEEFSCGYPTHVGGKKEQASE